MTPAQMHVDNVLQEYVERIHAAYRQGAKLRIRGANSKAFCCSWPDADRQERKTLDTCALRGVVSYEPSELVVCVRAGTSLTALEAVLAEHGQCLPFEPPHFGGATVGGMVSAGLAGPACANAGSVRDHVLGVQMINGRGQLLQFGGTVIKNVAGYDVSRLMVGSLGTLALLTQINLKVLPLAPAELTLHFACSQGEALSWLHAWGRQPLPLSASSWCADDLASSREGTLYVRLRGACAAVAAAHRQLGGERVEDKAAATHWQGCREQRLAWFQATLAQGNALWRLSVPPTAPVLAQADTFIEWHGGQRWVAASCTAQVGKTMQMIAQQVGGHARLFRAGQTQISPGTAAWPPLSPEMAAIHQALKREFDPASVFPELPWKQG